MMAENTKSVPHPLPQRLVLDASIIMAWLLADERSDQVELLMKHILTTSAQLLAPTVLPYELINSLRSATVQNRIATQTAHNLIEDFSQLHISEVTLSKPVQLLDIALTYQISSYDAAYVWVAKEQAAPLCTLDQKLQQKVRGYIQLIDLQAHI